MLNITGTGPFCQDFQGDEKRLDFFMFLWLVPYKSVGKSSVKKRLVHGLVAFFYPNILMVPKLDMFISLFGDFTVAKMKRGKHNPCICHRNWVITPECNPKPYVDTLWDLANSLIHGYQQNSASSRWGYDSPQFRGGVTIGVSSKNCLGADHFSEMFRSPYCWWFRNPAITIWDVKNPVNNGINYQPQQVSWISEPSTTVNQQINFHLKPKITQHVFSNHLCHHNSTEFPCC